MSQVERLLNAFKGEEADVLPWFADLTYWYSAHVTMGDLPEKYRGDEGRLRLYMELGCGAHEELYGPVVDISYSRVYVRRYREEYPDGIKEEVVYHTPVGELRGVRKYSYVSYSWAWVQHFVRSLDDLKILNFIYEDQKVRPSLEAYGRQERLMDLWDGWGIVSSLPPRIPFARMIVEWAGVVATYRLYWRSREALEETLQMMGEADDPIYDAILDAPAEFVYFGDNISSEVVGTPIFLKYYVPYYQRRTAKLRSRGKKSYVHIDGKLRGVLEHVHKSGVDCAQSLVPYPVGDVPLEEFRRLAGPDVVLWGGVPGVYFSSKYPERSLAEMVRKIVECYRDDGRFVVGVADQVPPDGEISRVGKVTEILEIACRG